MTRPCAPPSNREATATGKPESGADGRMGHSTMIARDKVAAFLMAHRGRYFCEPCLGRAVGIDPSTGHRAATRIARAGGFVREYGVCSECGESRLVTRAPC